MARIRFDDLAGDALHALCAAEPGLELRLRTRLLPAIARYAATTGALVAHRSGEPARLVVPRRQVAAWIGRMLIGGLPHAAGSPSLDAAPLFASSAPHELAKLRCMLAYVDRIADEPPRGTIEIERLVGGPHDWVQDPSPLQAVDVHATGVIEDAAGCRQVDFANAYLGGGVLTGGCVQEEILFAVAPELLVGLIVSPRLGPYEAIVMRGAERFAATSGYGFTLRYAGAFDDPCARASDGTLDTETVAIDALDYRGRGVPRGAPAILRELDKARTGFRRDARNRPVASGNWGCGVFLGDPVQKAIVQWLAASAEGRALRYYTFGDARLGDLAGFVAAARRFTVGELARRLFATAEVGGVALYPALLAA